MIPLVVNLDSCCGERFSRALDRGSLLRSIRRRLAGTQEELRIDLRLQRADRAPIRLGAGRHEATLRSSPFDDARVGFRDLQAIDKGALASPATLSTWRRVGEVAVGFTRIVGFTRFHATKPDYPAARYLDSYRKSSIWTRCSSEVAACAMVRRNSKSRPTEVTKPLFDATARRRSAWPIYSCTIFRAEDLTCLIEQLN